MCQSANGTDSLPIKKSLRGARWRGQGVRKEAAAGEDSLRGTAGVSPEPARSPSFTPRRTYGGDLGSAWFADGFRRRASQAATCLKCLNSDFGRAFCVFSINKNTEPIPTPLKIRSRRRPLPAAGTAASRPRPAGNALPPRPSAAHALPSQALSCADQTVFFLH